MTGPAHDTRGPLLVVALVGCAVAALAVTALAAVVAGGSLVWLSAGGSSLDRAMAGLLALIGFGFVGPPAVLMWVALARLATRPPGGARLMLGCLRGVGGLVLTIALPVVALQWHGPLVAAVVAVGLLFLGVAQLLAAAVPA